MKIAGSTRKFPDVAFKTTKLKHINEKSFFPKQLKNTRTLDLGVQRKGNRVTAETIRERTGNLLRFCNETSKKSQEDLYEKKLRKNLIPSFQDNCTGKCNKMLLA